MELTYENMKSFMERYFEVFNSHVNTAESIEQLDQLYTADFTSVAYIHIKGKKYPFTRTGRDEFKKSLMLGHVNIMEKLIPKDIIIDERKGIAGVLLTIENTIKKTGEKYVFDGIAQYKLCNREENRIKVEKLYICSDDPDTINRIYFQDMLASSDQAIGAESSKKG